MALTAQELTELNGYLDRRARRWRGWGYARIVFLAVGILFLGVGGYGFCLVHGVYQHWMDDGGPSVRAHPAPLTRADVRFEARMEAMMATGLLGGTGMALFQTLVGAYYIIYALANWRRHEKENLLIKVVREVVSTRRNDGETGT